MCRINWVKSEQISLSHLVDEVFLKSILFKNAFDEFTSLGIIATRKLGQLLDRNRNKKMKQLEKNMGF